ncbi:MAG: SDR family NAD(P)-dependent oxidoreductase [Actinomycetota bacterium]|jgi:NAD(P)-dependent dehydrogenase (short-subunit alcohol dehydrogenase family)|nr:SDR family NAD(P)-dependent oxidoreductase [Actinomycetota bacterium]
MNETPSGHPSAVRRVAVVTGASSGIGRATVVELTRRGAQVLAVARRVDRLEELAAETGAVPHAGDLDSMEACEAVIEDARRRLGPVSVLVNNAAAGSSYDSSVVDLDPERWRWMLAVNLDAPMYLTRLAARDMVAGGWGRIVMVSSTSANIGEPASAAYCASKAGLLGLMRAAAVDLGVHGVTCNAVLPGWVRTEMSDRSARRESEATGATVEQVWSRRAASSSGGRLATAEDVARVIGFLASDESAGVNGQAVTVAGSGLW